MADKENASAHARDLSDAPAKWNGNILVPIPSRSRLVPNILLDRVKATRAGCVVGNLNIKSSLAVVSLLFLFTLASVQAQWTPVVSGTSSDLHGVQLLESGIGLAVGDSGSILKTSDSGASWVTLNSGTTRALYGVYLFNDNEAIAVGERGLILRTADSGATWLTVTSGVRDTLRSVSFNGANGICGGDSQDILYSTDSGATWHVSQKGFFGGGFFGVQMLSPTMGFVAGQNSIFQAFVGVSVDGGVSWSFHNFYFNGNEGNCNDVHFFDSTTGLTSGALFDFTGAVARTINGAVDWNSTIFPQALEGIDFPTPEAGWVVGLGGAILNSKDMGVTFSPQTSGTASDLFDVSFGSDALTGVIVGQAGTILRTTNGGEEGGLELVAAASRKGSFDLELPLDGPPGIESRLANNRQLTIVFTFNDPILAVDPVGAATCGELSDVRVSQSDPHQVVASYQGAGCIGKTVTLTIQNIQDEQGHIQTDAAATVGLLLGDVSGDGVVNLADLRVARSLLGQTTDSSNFRTDVDVNGRIDRNDLRAIAGVLGSRLAP
jgi:photosystem II stability/assembly factor-like uncharacterized protein